MSFTTIISTNELKQNIHNENWVIFDCRSHISDVVGLKAYNENHIPNAIFCSLETDLSSPIIETTGRHPLPDFDALTKKLGDWGVDNQTQVVVYDGMGGADFASRLWWQLRVFGHDKVAVLDGGIPQWTKEGKQLSAEHPDIIPKTFTVSIDKNAWLSAEQIQANLTSKTFSVLDARAPERHRGEAEPFDTVAGRIPDSINRAFQLNLGEDGLFLKADELQNQFESIIKQTPNQSPKDIVHQCGSGVTACHNMLAMEIAGLTGSRLYAGSWSEWIRDDKRPVATG